MNAFMALLLFSALAASDDVPYPEEEQSPAPPPPPSPRPEALPPRERFVRELSEAEKKAHAKREARAAKRRGRDL